jgi:DNA-binding IclR family transcriptional regulator
VNLGVLSGDDVVYVDQASGARSIVSVSWVGRTTPLHCTAAGKVLVAFAGDADRARLLALPRSRETDRTIVDAGELEGQLMLVRSRGFAQTQEELEDGLNAVAAPIRRADGVTVAAVSVSGPAFRMRAIDLPRLGRITADAATAISRRLGFTGRLAD